MVLAFAANANGAVAADEANAVPLRGGRVSKIQDWFEHSWAVREEQIYPQLFGAVGADICVLTPEIFLQTFKHDSVDPRWLHYGVFECPPHGTREWWLYVSSGLSNAWQEDDSPDPTGPSGLGMEFILETPERSQWAILRLQHLVAFQILLACGRYPGRELIGLHDRIPLRAPITPEPSELTWLFVGPPDGYAESFALPTGGVELFAVVGVTEAEAAHARAIGGDALVELLRKSGCYPLTDPSRVSVVEAT
jgi:hypothetical protein